MSARRPLLTALGATTLLAALWFVPSANATAPGQASGSSGAPAPANTGTITSSDMVVNHAEPQEAVLALADTGSIDTTPYLMGGTLFLGLGAGFVTFSVRRSRAE
ncbi:LPXTG cell wall anchor domain-containing protein [Streptomyces sp. NPDC059999]|uniref:LPXTG cell wall anchor domain-containing protein n=1 Tax=unclassified Streptomyces TaxID=2593676 RepID=UPI002E373493|nr:LPXTG cell wall anchor domain-containing protein [Streptomyces sp. NBC_01426]